MTTRRAVDTSDAKQAIVPGKGAAGKPAEEPGTGRKWCESDSCCASDSYTTEIKGIILSTEAIERIDL